MSDFSEHPNDFPSAADDRLESQVYRKLFDQIRFGTYALGQRLPTEAELCEEHSVSRPVVRAALSKLRDSGLIVSRQGAGSFVASGVPTNVNGYSPLSSIEDIASYFSFRRIIEASAVELASARVTAQDVDKLRGIIDDIQQRLSLGEETVQLDIQLHTSIAELSDNRFLAETITQLQPHWIFVGNFVRSLGMTGQRKGKRMTAEHLAIVDALSMHDAHAARVAVFRHIEGSEKRVFKGEI